MGEAAKRPDSGVATRKEDEEVADNAWLAANTSGPNIWSTASLAEALNSSSAQSLRGNFAWTAEGQRQSPSTAVDLHEVRKRARGRKQRLLLPLVLDKAHRQASASGSPSSPVSILSYSLLHKDSPPWAHIWPEAVNYYMGHMPDYTGLGLFKDTSYLPSHAAFAAESPISLSAQILIAESAGLQSHERADKIAALKSWFVAQLNVMLKKASFGPDTAHESLEILCLIGALVCLELIWEDNSTAAAVHLLGLRDVVGRVGGLEQFRAMSLAVNVVFFADALHAHLYDKPFMIIPPEDSDSLFYTVHSIRLAFQPPSLHPPSARLRNHLLVGYGAPAQQIYVMLDYIKKLPFGGIQARGLFQNVIEIRGMPDDVRAILRDLSEFENHVYLLDTYKNMLDSDVFSDLDKKNHEDTYQVLRNCCLILIVRARQYLVGDSSQEATLDHHVQILLQELLDPTLGINTPAIICWAMCICLPCFRSASGDPAAGMTSLAESQLRDGFQPATHDALQRQSLVLAPVVSLFSRFCGRMGIDSWSRLEKLMRDVWYCPPLMEEPTRRLWMAVESHRASELVHLADVPPDQRLQELGRDQHLSAVVENTP